MDFVSWRPYTDCVVAAGEQARARGVRVLVVTQPDLSDAHVRPIAENLVDDVRNRAADSSHHD